MSLYKKIKAAQDNKDIEGYLDCLHEDFVFVRHQSGTEVSKCGLDAHINGDDGKRCVELQQPTVSV